MKRGWIIALAIPLLLAPAACTRRPKGVLSDKEMAPVVADLELAEAYLQANPAYIDNPDKKEAMIAYVLKKHGVKRKEFDATMDYYGRNVDEYREMYARVEKLIAEERREMTGVAAADKSTGDLWPYSRHSLISDRSGENGLSFSIPAGDLKPGERIAWKMRLRNSTNTQAVLGVEYDNGVRSYLYRKIGGSRRIELTLQTDTGRTVKNVFGYMTVDDSWSLPLWVDSLSLRTLPLDTMEYYNINSQRTWRRPARAKIEKVESDTTDNL